jgi:hypothetical protein
MPSQLRSRFRAGWRLRHYTGDVWEVIEADLPGDGQWHGTMIEAAGDYLIRCVSGRERERELRVHADYLSGSGWKLDPDSLVAENEALRELLRRAYRVCGSDDLARDIEEVVPDV